MQKVLFIDRDGTLVLETDDQQLDSPTKLTFYPEVFRYLGSIARELDYQLVMVTNQDGLGSVAFPEDTFRPTQELIIRSLAGEGIDFQEVIIDRTYAQEDAPTRKPGTALLSHYQVDAYDLANSLVIGDRLTDMALAKNLGARGILIGNSGLGDDELTTDLAKTLDSIIALKTNEWADIHRFLRKQIQA